MTNPRARGWGVLGGRRRRREGREKSAHAWWEVRNLGVGGGYLGLKRCLHAAGGEEEKVPGLVGWPSTAGHGISGRWRLKQRRTTAPQGCTAAGHRDPRAKAHAEQSCLCQGSCHTQEEGTASSSQKVPPRKQAPLPAHHGSPWEALLQVTKKHQDPLKIVQGVAV